MSDTPIDCKKLWQAAALEIELNITPANFIMWFKDTCIGDCKNDIVTINVPSGFIKDWLLDKYHKFILNALRNTNPNIRNVEYVIVQSSKSNDFTDKNKTRKKISEQVNEEQPSFSEFSVDSDTNLNPKYTFDSFVVASFNAVAHAAAVAVSQKIGDVYNPLFIYGGVGLGKTHLLQSIGNEIKKNNKNAKIQYVTSDKFAHDYITSLQNKTTTIFKEKYSSYNLLIVDDIQFFSDKLKIQEEFFHIFNTLYNNGNQIVFSSDKPPQHIVGLEERLRSRFDGGMMVDISKPTTEESLAILNIKMKQKGFPLPENIIEYVAKNIRDNIRELEGALGSIIGQSKLKGKILSLIEVADLLNKRNKPVKVATADKIIKSVTSYYSIQEKDLTQKTRRQEVVKPRQIAMYLLRNDLGISYPHIGRRLGQKDHTTAIHAFKKIKDEIKKNKILEQEIKKIRETINI